MKKLIALCLIALVANCAHKHDRNSYKTFGTKVFKETDANGKEKERVQIYEGLVMKVGGNGLGKTMTVRKISNGVGVEKIYPLTLPSIVKIELMRLYNVRRKNISFIRHSKKKLREKKNVKLTA